MDNKQAGNKPRQAQASRTTNALPPPPQATAAATATSAAAAASPSARNAARNTGRASQPQDGSSHSGSDMLPSGALSPTGSTAQLLLLSRWTNLSRPGGDRVHSHTGLAAVEQAHGCCGRGSADQHGISQRLMRGLAGAVDALERLQVGDTYHFAIDPFFAKEAFANDNHYRP